MKRLDSLASRMQVDTVALDKVRILPGIRTGFVLTHSQR